MAYVVFVYMQKLVLIKQTHTHCKRVIKPEEQKKKTCTVYVSDYSSFSKQYGEILQQHNVIILAHCLRLSVEVAKSIMLRYCESITVKLRNKSTGIYTRRPISRTRYACPFSWKNRLNSIESIRKQLSSNSASQFREISYEGTFSSRKEVTHAKYSTTTSPILSLRCVATISANFLMEETSLRLALLATTFSHWSKEFKIYKLASSSASESKPRYFSSSLRRPISMQVMAEYEAQFYGFYLLGSVKEGLPRLGLQGLGMWVPGWSWLPCLPFLWLEKAGYEEQILPQPHWYLVFSDFVI